MINTRGWLFIIRNRIRGNMSMANDQAWDFALGMTRMAGLEPTAKFLQYVEKEKRGEITMSEVKSYLDAKYNLAEKK